MPPNGDAIGLLLSGGLDSGVLLGHLLGQGRRVQPFYVRSQLAWEGAELAAVGRFLNAVQTEKLAPLVIFDIPLGDLYDKRHWSLTGRGAPDASTPDEAVYLPGRNALLMIKPALWCAMHGIEELALAVLRTNPFADATDEFFADFEAAIGRAAGRRVRIVRPFSKLDKKEAMELGRGLPLEFTFCCISPIGGLHCGRCNKCAERKKAFQSVGRDDPTTYANP